MASPAPPVTSESPTLIPDLLSAPLSTPPATPPPPSSVSSQTGLPLPAVSSAEDIAFEGSRGGVRSSIVAAGRKARALTERSGKRKQVSYEQLSRALKDIAQNPEQKKTQQQMVAHIFPKLSVYNTVDPSIGPSLVKFLQTSSNPGVLRYSYYFMSRILSESGDPQNSPGGGVPTPNWDSLAEMATGGAASLTRADVVPQILSRLVTEASTTDVAFHGRRMAALKSLVCLPPNSPEAFEALAIIVFQIFDRVSEDRNKRRRKISLFTRGSQDREAALRGNLYYGALSALRRLPMDASSEALVERIVLGIGCPDPVGVRHALAMACEIAILDPIVIAAALAKLAGGSLAAALRVNDVFARVYLARLCGILIHSSQLYDRPDIQGLFSAILFQLLYDTNDKVAIEAINCIAGSLNGEGTGEQRAFGWQILTSSEVDKREEKKDKKDKGKESTPHPSRELVLKVVVERLDILLRSSSRPLLHASLRCAGELGKARAAAKALGVEENDEIQAPEDDALDFAEAMGKVAPRERIISVDALLGHIMEGVRVVACCECEYIRAQALKVMIWMQSENESAEELKATLAGELSDPSWPPTALNSLLQTLPARFQLSASMAVMVLDLANLFVTRVPAKVDTNLIQALWKMCLVGCGAEGKHLALEAVSAVLDRPPPPPPKNGTAHGNGADTKPAIALQRLLQSAIWFLGENANYASAEYAWESATPPGAALMMLDSERMVAASGIRNPTLVSAITRLQRVVLVGNWEERVVGAHALITIAIRSGEPYRLQIYEFFHTLIYGGGGGGKGKEGGRSNGEDRGASGTGLQSVISPMLRVLDEMYQAQDLMMREIRQHDFSKEEWKEEELKTIFDEHERLMDLAQFFCFVPRGKYLPLGPVSAPLIDSYAAMKGISRNVSPNEGILADSLMDLLSYGGKPKVTPDFPPVTLLLPIFDEPEGGGGKGMIVGDGLQGGEEEAPEDPQSAYASAINFDNIWASSLLEADEDDSDVSDGSDSPTASAGGGNVTNWDEETFSGVLTPGGKPLGKESRSSFDSRSFRVSLSRRDSDMSVDREAAFSADNYDEEELRENQKGEARQGGVALYDFYASDEDELSLRVGDEVEIEYEVDGWFHVRKREPGLDGKTSGLVPVLYIK